MNNIKTIEGVKKTIFGSGAVTQLGNECKRLGASKALLVIDQTLSKSKIADYVNESLKSARIKSFVFSDVTPEPDPRVADLGTELALKEKVQCIIGVGGGSTMDIAKAIAMLVKNEGKAIDYIGIDKVKKQGIPAIMVPTTAGTGSESTFTAVFTQRETKKKGGINSPYLYPCTAILDPELTLDLPPMITAYTGMDALTHAIESYTSLKAHFMSEIVSLRAIELIMENLRGAVFDGKNIKYRENMMMGSYLAGMGLAMAGVGAVHALAYPMGAIYDIPHGIGNGLLLPYVLEYNYPGNIEKFCNMAMYMGQDMEGLSDRENASLVSEAVFELAEDIGVPMTLTELGIPEDAIPEMAKGAMEVKVPIANNPRPVTVEAAMDIYRNAYEG
ncbi:MAG: iron-containing alcohol dehydrogenase [Deltaproteobacteria bacterium]|nr:iron-containing alcohol dehydrogenase [Deltaproteobacteria bacterium]